VTLPLSIRASVVVLFLAVVGAAAQNSTSKPQPASSKSSPPQTANTESAAGERLFQTQCGRCHSLPEDLSPREAKAVLRQMRVRAMLTAEDERLILKYLAP
jgi:cytochrome c5